MNYRVTVDRGLAAHFKQPSGPSHPGIDWMLRIEGPKSGVVIVRTLFAGAGATEEEKAATAQRALDLVQQKLEAGWDPTIKGGILEA